VLKDLIAAWKRGEGCGEKNRGILQKLVKYSARLDNIFF